MNFSAERLFEIAKEEYSAADFLPEGAEFYVWDASISEWAYFKAWEEYISEEEVRNELREYISKEKERSLNENFCTN